MARVAVVTQHPERESLLRRVVGHGRHEVRAFPIHSGLDLDIQAAGVQMIVLDWDAGDVEEESTFLRLRTATEVPILVLGGRYDELFIVRALKMGADGCLSRPYGAVELAARVDACLRRYLHWSEERKSHVDLQSNPVGPLGAVIVGGKRVQLSGAEKKLLACLQEHGREVVTHDELCERVWGIPREKTHTNLRLCIHNLRKKLERNPRHPQYILTKWGVGYYLARDAREG